MKIPVDSQRFTAFIEEHHLFDKTKDHLITFLKNFYMQKPEEFEEMLYADADKVIHSYDFVNEGVSLSKSFSMIRQWTIFQCGFEYTTMKMIIWLSIPLFTMQS